MMRSTDDSGTHYSKIDWFPRTHGTHANGANAIHVPDDNPDNFKNTTMEMIKSYLY